MSFKLDLSTKYRWPVKLSQIGEDGKPIQSEFHADFARVYQSDCEKIIKDVQSGEMSDQQFIERLVVGWDGILEESGSAMPFTPDALAHVTDILGVRGAIVRAWFESIREGPGKN